MSRFAMSLSGAGWHLRGFLGEEWRTVDLGAVPRPDRPEWIPATVPGAVVADLHAAGEVVDPYLDRDSLAVEWVADRAWLYARRFAVAEDARHGLAGGGRAHLRLDGLETPAHVYLDGALLGDHGSPSLPATFEVTESLRGGADHGLAVVLERSPHEEPQLGRTSLVRRHRGRMREGWDFCPRFPEAGISGGVSLELTGPARIESVAVRPHLDAGLRHATVELEATVDARSDRTAVDFAIEGTDGSSIEAAELLRQPGRSVVRRSVTLEAPDLWWCNGLGPQPLYRATVTARAGGEVSDVRTVEFGIRSVRLVANEAAPDGARPYTLEVNGRRTYLRGWNWVPDDVMPGVDRPGRLDRLLELARHSGANLLRVWGGGRIESEAFYSLCDRLGLLVWQEFLLSSAGQDNEPAGDPEYVARVVREAEAIVPARLNHPSMAIWCGGNELSRGPRRQPLDESASPVLQALGDLVRRLDPERSFLATSPSGPAFMREAVLDPESPVAAADLHDVHGPWHHGGLGRQERLVNTAAPLLHSEFGAPSLADLETIEATVSATARGDMSWRNPTWRHRAAWWICDDLVRETFQGAGEDLAASVEGLEWASQYLQAQALRGWIEANRRHWPRNSGSIPWQLDEPYPGGYGTCSVDWFCRPKAAFWAVRRAYAPLLVSARIARETWDGDATFDAEIWLTADEATDVEGALEARVAGADGRLLAAIRQPLSFRLEGSAVVACVSAPLERVRGCAFALDLALGDATGEPLAANRYLLTAAPSLAPLADAQRLRSLEVAAIPLGAGRRLVSILNAGRSVVPTVRLGRLTDAAGRPLLHDGALPSDDAFSLLPGERRTLLVARAGAGLSSGAGAVRPSGRVAAVPGRG